MERPVSEALRKHKKKQRHSSAVDLTRGESENSDDESRDQSMDVGKYHYSIGYNDSPSTGSRRNEIAKNPVSCRCAVDELQRLKDIFNQKQQSWWQSD